MSDRYNWLRESEHGSPPQMFLPRREGSAERNSRRLATADNSAVRVVHEIGLALLIPLTGTLIVECLLYATSNWPR